MIVIIPTYKRLDRLKWTLLSLMRNRVRSNSESLRIGIANNHPPVKNQIELLVADVKKSHQKQNLWEWHIIHREKTVDAAENCLSAMKELTNDDEIVIVQGDDDLFTPWSIQSRIDAIEETNCDMLLTKSKYSLWYLNETGSIYFGDEIPSENSDAVPKELEWKEINNWVPIFLGNNAYRYSKKFQAAMDKVYSWINAQEWVDFNTRSMMWPFYLPNALKIEKGRIYGLDQFGTIRGNLLNERVKDPFEVSFNTGLISLLAYGILHNSDLNCIEDLNQTRRELATYIGEWLLPMKIDKRVSKEYRQESFKRIPLNREHITIRALLRGVQKVVKNYTGLQLLMTRRRAAKSEMTITQLLDELEKQQKE